MNELKPIVTHQGRDYDLSHLYRSVSWSGSVRQVAREVHMELLVPGQGRQVPAIPLDKGDLFRLTLAGEELFYGYVVQRRREAGALTMTLGCLDRGWHLAGNDGWYSFACTPEAAARTICADHGIPMGSLAQTGVTVERKFPGVELHRIINTMYTKAAEVTGERYQVYFDGAGRLNVRVKPKSGTAVLAPKMDLSEAIYTEDISSICTSVSICGEDGGVRRTIDDADTRRAYGLFRRIITQREGTDAAAEARTYLEDWGEQQSVAVTCLGSPGLVAGTAVTLKDQSSGARGLFWVDSDTHTWQNGRYLCNLTLNFRNLMDQDNAGTEVA